MDYQDHVYHVDLPARAEEQTPSVQMQAVGQLSQQRRRPDVQPMGMRRFADPEKVAAVFKACKELQVPIGENRFEDGYNDGGGPASETRKKTALAVAAMLMHAPAAHAGIIGILQNNVLGTAQFHRQQSWPFDPDVSARRTHEFVALHGDKSEWLIERIGLGLDGRQQERREQQAVRDILYDQQHRNEPASGAGGAYHHNNRLQQLQPQPVQAYPAGYARRR